MRKVFLLFYLTLASIATSYAAEVSVTIFTTDEHKKPLGQVVFKDTTYGMLISPQLTSLPAGLHGFHLHQHKDCSDHGAAAGGHFDPMSRNSHQGPYGHGHLGDLPALYVDSSGKASTPTLAPRLKTSDLKGLTIMVHAGGDNYSDNPALGGGGARMACGVIQP